MGEPPSLELTEAFRDFIDMGIDPALTLIDAIFDNSLMHPHFEAILFGGIGTYLHTLQVEHLHGFEPQECHQLGVLAVCQDPRISSMIDFALNATVISMTQEKLGVEKDE